MTVNPDGTFTYDPDLSFNGTDSFTFQATDGVANSNLAFFDVTVTAVNDAPTCADDSGTTAEDVDLIDSVLCADVDGDGEIDFPGRRVEGPTPHGTGCALSSEIACRLAFGASLREAVRAATERVRVRIAEARVVGRGRPFLG